MPTVKEQIAQVLADKHFAIEPGIKRIFRLADLATDEARETEPIKLLEVSETTIPLGVQAIKFGPIPQRGIPYPSVIIEITPAEFDSIQSGELKLPNGWVISEELSKPAELEEVA